MPYFLSKFNFFCVPRCHKNSDCIHGHAMVNLFPSIVSFICQFISVHLSLRAPFPSRIQICLHFGLQCVCQLPSQGHTSKLRGLWCGMQLGRRCCSFGFSAFASLCLHPIRISLMLIPISISLSPICHDQSMACAPQEFHVASNTFAAQIA